MSFAKHCAIAIALIFVCGSTAAVTQAEMNGQACARYKKADAELNRVYKTILAQYGQDKVFIEKLKLAQRAWLTYRDMHAAAVFPEQDKNLHYGSVYPTCHCGVMEKMTLERTSLLKRWAVSTEEGEVCSGSARSR